MSILKNKAPAIIVMGSVLVLFIGTVIYALINHKSLIPYLTPATMIDGEYSVDGGKWETTSNKKLGDEHFHKIVIKGKFRKSLKSVTEMYISTKNIWYTIKTSDGELIYTNNYREKGTQAYNLMFEDYEGKLDESAVTEAMEEMPMAMKMYNSPGYSSFQFDYNDLSSYFDKEIVLEIENPYNSLYSLSTCIIFTQSMGNGAYMRAISEAFRPTMFLLLILFFGIILFPTISFVFGKINFKYLSFGFLCFFWSIYMIMYHQSWYLIFFIPDPCICMMIDKLAEYFFAAALLVFFRSNLGKDSSRIISGIVACVYTAAVFVVLILHMTNTFDLIQTSPYIHLLIGISIVVIAVLFAREAVKDKRALYYLLTWIPMVITLLIDVFDQFLAIPGNHYFRFGFAVTLAFQILQMIVDIRHQYREAIRYQQMQKELYEAKVSVMVSQIQPHFMYNALSSIAILCKLEPETAYNATVTFSQYLRGNMDSLKQTAPVSFEKELEHLKKYLYIEKLRFADKLNIEYDIQTTDFEVPMLSVQPIVENAVKHGVGMKKGGGTVKISTGETDNAYKVIISDDGVGFDVNAPKKDDGRSHIGMENTKRRLKDMCDADIITESEIGKGTTTTVIIPKKKENDEK